MGADVATICRIWNEAVAPESELSLHMTPELLVERLAGRFGTPRRICLLAQAKGEAVGTVTSAAAPEAASSLLIIFGGTAETEDLWLYLNDQPVGCAARVVAGERGTFRSQVAVFDLPAGAAHDGTNEIIVRCENTTIRIVGLEVRFAEK